MSLRTIAEGLRNEPTYGRLAIVFDGNETKRNGNETKLRFWRVTCAVYSQPVRSVTTLQARLASCIREATKWQFGLLLNTKSLKISATTVLKERGA